MFSKFLSQNWHQVKNIANNLQRIAANAYSPSEVAKDVFGSYAYYQIEEKGKNYPSFCRECVKSGEQQKEYVINLEEIEHMLKRPVVLNALLPSVQGEWIASLIQTDVEEFNGIQHHTFVRHMKSRKYYKLVLPKEFDDLVIADLQFERNTGCDESVLPILYVSVRQAQEVCSNMILRCDLNGAVLCGKHELVLSADHCSVVIDERDRPEITLSMHRSKDNQTLHVQHHSKSTSYASIIPEGSGAKPQLFAPIISGQRYFVESGGGNYYVFHSPLLNDMRTRDWQRISSEAAMQVLRIESSSSTSLPIGNWQMCSKLYPQTSGRNISIEDYDLFESALVLYGRYLPGDTIQSVIQEDDWVGECTMQLVSLEKEQHLGSVIDCYPALAEAHSQWMRASGTRVASKPLFLTIVPRANRQWTARTVDIELSTPTIPSFLVTVCLRTGKLIQASMPTMTQWDAQHRYAMLRANIFRCWTKSRDSVAVPMTVVEPMLPNAATIPTVIIAYGSYGVSLSTAYRPEYQWLVESGWRVVFAHVRGGNELGRGWHEDGKLQHKWNTFFDFEACASHWFKRGETVWGWGHSAGGLVMGVAAACFPHLFAGLVLQYPFLRVKDLTDALAEHEREEWGPEDEPIPTDFTPPIKTTAPLKTFHDYRESYCPITLAQQSSSPDGREHLHTLVTVGSSDHKVSYDDACAWNKAMATKRFAAQHLINETHWDHEGPGNTPDYYKQLAIQLAFLVHCKNARSLRRWGMQ